MTQSGKAIFLSYASEDADAAKRICDALSAAGLEVWLDQSELRGGDAWDASIRARIRREGSPWKRARIGHFRIAPLPMPHSRAWLN